MSRSIFLFAESLLPYKILCTNDDFGMASLESYFSLPNSSFKEGFHFISRHVVRFYVNKRS